MIRFRRKIMKKIISVFCMALFAITLVGCSNMNNGTGGGFTKQDMGVLAGGTAGALLGSQFGGGSGQAVAIAAGAVAGALVGSQIGKYMDKTDKLEMDRALESTRTGQAASWRNPDSGNQYTVKPTKTFYKNNQACREYTTTAWIGGKKENVHGTACRQSDGSWKVMG
jgi:surface antigen